MERKISEPNIKDICRDPEHEPASMLYRTAGTYEHTCPHCGKKTTFTMLDYNLTSS